MNSILGITRTVRRFFQVNVVFMMLQLHRYAHQKAGIWGQWAMTNLCCLCFYRYIISALQMILGSHLHISSTQRHSYDIPGFIIKFNSLQKKKTVHIWFISRKGASAFLDLHFLKVSWLSFPCTFSPATATTTSKINKWKKCRGHQRGKMCNMYCLWDFQIISSYWGSSYLLRIWASSFYHHPYLWTKISL